MSRRFQASLLIVLALAVLLPQAMLITVQRGAELDVALAARKIARGVDLPAVVQGHPPLPYWLVAGAHRLLGGWTSPGVTRLAPVAASMALVLTIAIAGAVLVGRRRAHWAALVAATSWLFVRFGPLAEPEGFAALASTLGGLLVFLACTGPRPMVSAVGAGLCMGLAVLGSGWGAGLVPALTLALAPLVLPELDRRRMGRLLAAALVPALLVVGVGGYFWLEGDARSLAGLWRMALDAEGGRTRSLFYYVLRLPVLMLPWGPLLIPALWVLWRRRSHARQRFLALWWVLSIAVPSLLPNKQEQNLFLLLAPSALVVASYLLCASCSREGWRPGLVWGYMSGWAMLVVLSAAMLFILPLLGLGFSAQGCILTGSAVLLLAVASVGSTDGCLFRRRFSSLVVMLVGAYLSYPLIFHEVHRPESALVQVGQAVRAAKLSEGARRVFVVGPGADAVRYYLDGSVHEVGTLEEVVGRAEPGDVAVEIRVGDQADDVLPGGLVPAFRERRPGYTVAYYVFPPPSDK